jgi:hypothetical protein
MVVPIGIGCSLASAGVAGLDSVAQPAVPSRRVSSRVVVGFDRNRTTRLIPCTKRDSHHFAPPKCDAATVIHQRDPWPFSQTDTTTAKSRKSAVQAPRREQHQTPNRSSRCETSTTQVTRLVCFHTSQNATWTSMIKCDCLSMYRPDGTSGV